MSFANRWQESQRLTRLLLLVFLGWLLVGLATRLALCLHAGVGADWPALARALLVGGLWDALVASLLLALPAGALQMRATSQPRPRLRLCLLWALFAALIFGAFIEFFFFEEFDARFNHIALDYLLFPGEVAGNIWESYPVPLYVGAALGGGLLLASLVQRGLRGAAAPARGFGQRLRSALLCMLVGAVAWTLLYTLPAPATGDRRWDELCSNGLVQLARAYATAGLDYASYYRSLPRERMLALAGEQLGWSAAQGPQREHKALVQRDQPLDVVVILGESFGSDFVGLLGGQRPNAPGFERWADRGLLCTNLVATGNRTVRGLEGVLCSFVPLPGDSIWKREKSEHVASLAGVLAEQGYRTEFVYGGEGSFDGMQPFALKNGWQVFHEDALVGASAFPKDAFRTVWGAADEHIFDVLLERQRAAQREQTRFFGTALTVSNHKPYLNPDSPSIGLRQEKLLSAGVWIAVLCALLGVWLWRVPRGPQRWPRMAGALVLLGLGLLLAWTKVQPRDTRESAVRYADKALANYLDRAQAEGLLEHTVVLFVGDHGARVYGSEAIPAQSYRIPALFLSPDAQYQGARIERLCSQVDLAPTLLSLAGVDARTPFFGSDLLSLPPDGPGRAWLIHNRDVGLLTDTELTVLGLRGTTDFYRRDKRESDVFTRELEPADGAARADRAAAVFQLASELYEQRLFCLGMTP